MTQKYVVLLRGINVGGKHSVPMKVLSRIVEDVGCRDVLTYIQSGNVLFSADPPLANRAPALIQAAIARQLGIEVPVVMRSAAELEQVLRNNPFLVRTRETHCLHVAFLTTKPTRTQIAALDTQLGAPDQFTVAGDTIFLSLQNGVAKTKLTNKYFDIKLATTCTVRNWNTVQKLVALATITAE
jgi:uncharacterized protein (DUF1697 family)